MNIETNMTVEQLIKELEKYNKDKIVVLSESDGIGWDNIGLIIETSSSIKICMDDNGLFGLFQQN